MISAHNSHASFKKGCAQSDSPAQDGQGEKVGKSRWQPKMVVMAGLWQKFNSNNPGEFCADS